MLQSYQYARQPLMLLERAGLADVEATRRAWEEHVHGGGFDEQLVRPHVTRAWLRSKAGGCDPERPKADVLDVAATQELLDREAALLSAAHPYLGTLSRAAGDHRHAAMLGDKNGRVLDVVGDPNSVRGPEAVPGPGALLDEASAGANGLGTPLAEGSYVELVGPEHYIKGFHIFTCQGVPLRDAEGAVSGVLGISVRRLETANRVHDILFCAAQGIECDLLGRTLSQAVAAATNPGGPDLAERLRQDLVQRLTAAQLRFELAAHRLARGGSATDLLLRGEALIDHFRALATTWRDLVSEGAHAPAPVLLHDLVAQIMDLLATEARIAGIEVSWRQDRSATVLQDRQALARGILATFLSAMQAAGRSGSVRVDVDLDKGVPQALLRLVAAPASGTPTTLECVAGQPA